MSKAAQLSAAILVLLLCAASIALVGLIYYVRGKSQGPPLKADLCPSDRSVKGHVVVAVDWTDPLSEQQREALRDTVRELKHKLGVHERLSLVVITGNAEDSANPIFSICNPLDPEKINPLTENEKKLKAKWSEQFGKPLEEKLAQLLQGGTAPHSPIMEAFNVIMWSPNFNADLPRRQLIVFSDLLQNWRDHSQYKKVPGACEFMRTRTGQNLKERNWAGVSVVLHRWRSARDSHLQDQAHLNFWTDSLYQFGAAEVRVGMRLADRGGSCIETQSLPSPKPKAHKPKPPKKDDSWFPVITPFTAPK